MQDKSEVVFVNSVAVTGFANGVCNIAFSTARFTPSVDQSEKPIVAVDEYVSANLRMDLFCVQQLHDSLASILAQQTKPAPRDVN